MDEVALAPHKMWVWKRSKETGRVHRKKVSVQLPQEGQYKIPTNNEQGDDPGGAGTNDTPLATNEGPAGEVPNP